MRRWFSLFLTLVLLLSLLPGTVLAAGARAPAEDTPAVEVQPEDAPAMEVRPEVPADIPHVPVVPEAEDLELLASGNASVSGTVSLPGGASVLSDSYLFVYLCTPPVLDEDGQVLEDPVTVRSCQVDFAQGQCSGSYSISGVEAGRYILCVESYIHSGSVLGGNCYFNANGTPADNPYAAAILNVGAGTNVNLTLPAAPRSISGTLVFNTAPSADVCLRLYCYGSSLGSFSSAVTLKAGSTTASFSIGVTPEIYFLEIFNINTNTYGCCDIYGSTTKDYLYQMPFNTLEESVSGLAINCTSLLGSSGSGGGSGGGASIVDVTVQLPAPLPEDRMYEVFLVDDGGYYIDSYITHLSAGDASFALPLTAHKGERFMVGYSDCTDCTNYYISPTGTRYAAESGITTQLSQAKVFTGGVDEQITIAEPACYTLTGTLTREGNALPSQAAYVQASFPNGEVYAARVVFAQKQISAPYTIYVPQSQQGQTFQLSVCLAVNGLSNTADESTEISGGSHTFSGSLQTDLTLPAQPITISGTLSLPAGMAAPEGGLVISLGGIQNGRYSKYATYYLAEGMSSLHYALCAPVSDRVEVFAEISGSMEGMIRQVSCTFPQDQLMEADMVFPEAVTVSGTISVPEACLDGVALVYLFFAGTLNGSGVSADMRIAVPASQQSVPYSLTLPKGTVLTQGHVVVVVDTSDILDNSTLYLQSDLKTFSSQYAILSTTLNHNLALDIQLDQGVFFSGTLTLAEGLSAGTYSGCLYLQPVSGGSTISETFVFTGSSSDFKVLLPPNCAGQYYVYLCLYEGPGILAYKDYYYAGPGASTADRDQAVPISIGEDGAVVNLTIPKAKTISGRLVSEDGSQVVWNPEKTLWLYLDSDTGYESVGIIPDAQGNWSATVDPSFTGESIVYIQLYGTTQTNILGNRNYYYSTAGHAVTTEAEASRFTIGEEDVTGLNLYVETGWLLSGAIRLPEGSYITGGIVNISVIVNAVGSSSASYWGSGTVGSSGGSYSAVVPKQAAEYQIVLPSISSPEVSSNIYWGETQSLNTGSITGDTGGLDFTLIKAGTVLTGTMYRPEGVEGSLNLNLCALVKRDDLTWSYNTNASINYSDDSGNFSIAIPASETATEYQLYYTINSGAGVVTQKNIYLCADGSLTTDPSLADTFSLADPPVHTFTPLTALPFAAGKIYCPEGLEQTTIFVVYPQRASEITTLEFPQGAVEVMVGPGSGQQDENGWFSTYSLNDPSFTAGAAYRLICYSNDSSTPADTSWYYVNQDGTLTKNMDHASVYTVSDTDPNTVDFTPFLWDDGMDTYVLQSEHGISSIPVPATYTYTCPGASSLKVTFSARTDMDLTVNGAPWYCQSQAGDTITVDGNTLTVFMPALDFGGTYKFGFAVEKVTPDYGSSTPQTGAAAVYTPSGSSGNAILSDVKAGKPVRVTLVGQPAGEQRQLLGALYDEKGILLDFVQVPVTFTESGCTTSLSFEKYGGADTLKIFLVDEDLVPEMENCSFRNQ